MADQCPVKGCPQSIRNAWWAGTCSHHKEIFIMCYWQDELILPELAIKINVKYDTKAWNLAWNQFWMDFPYEQRN